MESPGAYVGTFTWPFYLYLVLFWTTLPCSGGLSPGVCGMLLHNAVMVNCKIRATTDFNAYVPSKLAMGCVFDKCACVI